MWIAKPLPSLNLEEQFAWYKVVDRAQTQGEEAPLAQSLAWGRAIEAVSGQVFVIFSPQESVGGLVFSSDGSRFECVNGPLLDWDNATEVPRQLATFAEAAARLSPRFSTLSLKPRWRQEQVEQRLERLPVSATTHQKAATLKIGLSPDQAADATFSRRLKRTLQKSERAQVQARWEEIDPPSLVEFALASQAFGRTRGFTVPPVFWFRTLTQKPQQDEGLRFALVTAQTPLGDAGCQLLIAWYRDEAHYLFGHEWRPEGARAAVSPAAVAHRLAIQKSAQAGMRFYDLNGYLEDAPVGHPYAGVAAFKAQLGGHVVRYEAPEILIVKS